MLQFVWSQAKPSMRWHLASNALLYFVHEDCQSPLGPDSMNTLLRFPGAIRRDLAVETWFSKANDELRRFAKPWFERMRGCGADVRELLNDGHPIACVEDAAFGYVDAFAAHVNVGFFYGVALDDPGGLLEGTGKRMRHVKLRWAQPVNAAALSELIMAAYHDMQLRLRSSG
jgi:hypothetical protein